jgi:dTDP-4-amino-4,6-dideoxygalactose transaminase
MQVPYMNLSELHQPLKHSILQRIGSAIDDSDFISGSAVSEFESKFSSKLLCNSFIGVSSGTAALHVALLSLGVGVGDEVITTSATFAATIAAIKYVGATVVLVDVDPSTYLIPIDAILDKLTEKTKAIIPVHLHGACVDVQSLRAALGDREVFIVEDAAQAHLAKVSGQYAGTIGDVGCFSFYPGKNLGAFGEGGGITAKDVRVDRIARALKDWGQFEKGRYSLHGFNYRMDTFQGIVLSEKLNFLEEWTKRRIEIAGIYQSNLAEIQGLKLPVYKTDYSHVYHVYGVRTARRDELKHYLLQRGISTGIHYPSPVHLLAAYQDLGYRQDSLPNSEALSRELLSLPICPTLTDQQVDYVCSAIKLFFAR